MTRQKEKLTAIDALQGLGRISDLVKKDVEASGKKLAQSLPISDMVPDPHQARRILPAGIRERFFGGEIDPIQALKEWKQLAERDRQEESMLEAQILRLASSLKAQEQIYPITVSVIQDDPFNRYLIETGERRWWAHWWLFGIENEERFENVQAVVVEEPSPWRQAAENLQGEPLSAIQEACQIARLLLVEEGIEPTYAFSFSSKNESGFMDVSIDKGYEFYRQAAIQRAPQGVWEHIEQATGKGRRYCQYLLGLFKLCDDALLAAERGRLTESQLRPVASGEQDPERQLKIINFVIENDLGRDQIANLVQETDLDDALEKLKNGSISRKTLKIRAPEEIVVERLLSMTRLLDRASRSESSILQVVTRELIQDGEIEKRRLELASLRSFLGELMAELDKKIYPGMND